VVAVLARLARQANHQSKFDRRQWPARARLLATPRELMYSSLKAVKARSIDDIVLA
jgi:hypothetical protein